MACPGSAGVFRGEKPEQPCPASQLPLLRGADLTGDLSRSLLTHIILRTLGGLIYRGHKYTQHALITFLYRGQGLVMCQTLTMQAEKDYMRDTVMFTMVIMFKALRKIILLQHVYEKHRS